MGFRRRLVFAALFVFFFLAPDDLPAVSYAPPVRGAHPLRERTGLRPARVAPRSAKLSSARRTPRLPKREGTYRLLAIALEFPPDEDPATTGTGVFGDVLDANEVIYGRLFPALLDLPHDGAYIREQLRYLSEYYAAASYGALRIEPTVPDTIFTAPMPMGTYGENEEATDHQALLLAEAVRLADPVVDFSLFDGVFVVHAGVGEETDILGDSPGDIWTAYLSPADLASALADSGMEEAYRGIPTEDRTEEGDTFFVGEGVLLPESESQDALGGTPLAQWVLGVSAHMMGRLLGAPSLFDTDSEDGTSSQGVGNFDIMGTGLWNSGGILPPHPSAWTKVFLGWAEALPVTRDTTILLPLVERADSAPKVLKVPISRDEYWLIENRYKDENGDSLFNFADANGDGVLYPFEDSYEGAEFDWSLPAEGTLAGSGVLIWHIDEAKIRESGDFKTRNAVNADPGRKGVDLEEADGIRDLDVRATGIENFGSPFDSWRAGGHDRFGPDTDPGTETNWGAATGITISVESGAESLATVSISFRERPAGWPVRAPGGIRIVGPVIPVRSPQEGVLAFGYAFEDSAAGAFYGSLLGVGGRPLPGWPVELPGEASFAPVAVAPAEDGPVYLYFPLLDGSIVRVRTNGALQPAGSFVDPVPGSVAHALSSSSPRGPILSAVVTGEGTTLFAVNPSTGRRVPAATFDGKATGPAAMGEVTALSTEDGVLHLLPGGGSVREEEVAASPSVPVLFTYDADAAEGGEEESNLREVAVAAGDELFLLGADPTGARRVVAELGGRPTGPPAVADIDRDGAPEILIGSEDGRLQAFHRTGAPSTGWPLPLIGGPERDPFDPPIGSPAAGDIDGDGTIEIAFVTKHGSWGLVGADGALLPGFPIASAASYPFGLVMVASLDEDTTFLLAPSEEGAFDLLAFPSEGGRIEWAGYGNGAALSGNYGLSPYDRPPSGERTLVEAETFGYPNPVGTEGIAHVRYRVRREALLSLRIYGADGSLIREFPERKVPADTGEFAWDTRETGGGVYFARIEVRPLDAGGSRLDPEVRFVPIAVAR